jgi:hypothetical protein
MKGSVTHAARFVSAACAFSVLTSCGVSTDDPATPNPTIAFSTDTARLGEVNVYPLSRRVLAELESSKPSAESWPRLLSVRVGEDSTALPLLGTYAIAGDTLRFRPRFPPSPGVTYVARLVIPTEGRNRSHPDRGGEHGAMTATWRYDAPAGAPSTVVTAIYPTADVVPMNLLRMYVEFSAPMSSGHAYDFVKLYAEGDSLVEEPFFTAGGEVELWDPDHTRLTILFDPGRIKRDLKPHEEMGLPLRAGKRYRLVIDSTWRDAAGRPLVRSFTKQFRVGPQDRALIRTATWRITPPRAGTTDSLVVTFPEPLDRALLARLVTVHDSAGARIDGVAVVTERETRWVFAPSGPWGRGSYALHVDTELEDLAGNNLKKLFDVAPDDSAATGVSASVVRVAFQSR